MSEGGLKPYRGEMRSELHRRIEHYLDTHSYLSTMGQAGEIIDLIMDMATTPPDPSIKEAAPDLIPAAGGLYQELLSFVLTAHSTRKCGAVPDWAAVYTRAVRRLREAGWIGGPEFDLSEGER